jgi:hypothetical protein
VLEALERAERAVNHLVRGCRVEARNERDTAGVVLERRVVEPDSPALVLASPAVRGLSGAG